jgi:hypothetical protein
MGGVSELVLLQELELALEQQILEVLQPEKYEVA